jgi:Leucine-rich repeat (LRR) protein
VDTEADLSFLREFDQPLTRLSVYKLKSGDLTPLTAHADSLENVGITTTDVTVTDVTPVLRLRKLRSLNLGVDGLTDLGFVKELPELDSLHLSRLGDVTDLSPLGALSSLKSLGVNHCSALSEVRDLPQLYSLTSLWMIDSRLTTGLDELAGRMPRLADLYLNHSKLLKDLRQLTPLPLKTLGLWGCHGITDFTPLSEMRELTFLDLEDTDVGDLAPIAELTGLQTLWLRKCENVTDLTPLAALRNLRQLYIAGIAPGTDLAPLADNHRLTVYLERNQDVRNQRLLGRRAQAD